MSEEPAITVETEGLDGPYLPCHLSVDPFLAKFTAIGYGQVWDGQLPAEWGEHSEEDRIQFLFDEDLNYVKGLQVHEPFEIEPGALPVWEEPRFDVPVLGLTDASVGEVILAVQGRFRPDEPTSDVAFFQMAAAACDEGDLDQAVDYWRCTIEAGDMKGRFGLGYTLHDLGRFREAYDQLRLYAELTPHNAWAWCWLGKVCEELGHRREAVDAYRCATEMERLGGFETDALRLLRELEEVA